MEELLPDTSTASSDRDSSADSAEAGKLETVFLLAERGYRLFVRPAVHGGRGLIERPGI